MSAWAKLLAASSLAFGTAWDLITHPKTGGATYNTGVAAELKDASLAVNLLDQSIAVTSLDATILAESFDIGVTAEACDDGVVVTVTTAAELLL